MNEQVEEIMRLASLLATARCRRMAVNQYGYRGVETEKSTSIRVDEATATLRAAVEAFSRAEFDRGVATHQFATRATSCPA